MRPAQLLTILEREFVSTREGHHTPVMLWESLFHFDLARSNFESEAPKLVP